VDASPFRPPRASSSFPAALATVSSRAGEAVEMPSLIPMPGLAATANCAVEETDDGEDDSDGYYEDFWGEFFAF